MKLNKGRVIKQGPRVFRFVIQDQQGLKHMIDFLNGSVVLQKTKKKLKMFIEAYNKFYTKAGLNKTRPNNISVKYIETEMCTVSLENSWLAGFTDGDGCFNISYIQTKNKFIIRFLVSQQEDLSFLRDIFQTGTIEYNKSTRNYSFVISD